jgi:hypothetical protein
MGDEPKPVKRSKWPYVLIAVLVLWNVHLESQIDDAHSVATAADWKATSALNKANELEAEIEEPCHQ